MQCGAGIKLWSFEMKKFWAIAVILVVACQAKFSTDAIINDSTALGKRIAGTRYLDSIFTSAAVTSDVIFSTVYNPYKKKTETLKLDIYRPGGDNEPNRRAVVFVYGGGFWQGNKTQAVNVAFCKTLAKCGYVVFAIEYRKFPQTQAYADTVLRIDLGSPLVGSDVRAAVAWMRTRAGTYKIAADKITAIGTSSGGFGVMSAAYDAAIDSLNGTNGTNGTPNLTICTSGGLPLGTVDRIEANENPFYIVHCTADPIPFEYADSCYNRGLAVGVDASNWWIDGLCHGAIKCCWQEFFINSTVWMNARL